MDQLTDSMRKKPLVARWLERRGVQTTPKVDRMLSWMQTIIIIVVLVVALGKLLNPIMSLRSGGSGSMEPTIQAGDIFLIEKISWKLGLRPLQPGDIISFEFKDGRAAKRIIAVGGQLVQMRDCSVYINGKPLTSDKFNHPDHPDPRRRCYYDFGGYPGERLIVPKGHYFVLGDNSQYSFDSRFEVFGFVKHEDVNGRYLLRIWPPSRFGVP